MFIEEVYRVSWAEKETLDYKGQSYEVTPVIEKECKMITKVHSVLIGVGVIFGYALAEALHSQSFFADLLMIALVLAFLSFLMNYISKFLIGRRLKK